MEGKSDPPDVVRRSFQYSLRAIRLYRALQEKRDGAAWILGKQFLRAATSIRANIEEGQSGESRADFIHKYGIAQKEARESLYWLRLLGESDIVPAKRLAPLIGETEELYAICSAIVVKAKKGLNSMKGGR